MTAYNLFKDAKDYEMSPSKLRTVAYIEFREYRDSMPKKPTPAQIAKLKKLHKAFLAYEYQYKEKLAANRDKEGQAKRKPAKRAERKSK